MRHPPCVRCGRGVQVSWWWLFVHFPDRRVACAELNSCLGLVQAQTEGPPDPPWFEQEPRDAWICSTCHGSGEVITGQDWATGALNIEGCSRCSTIGIEPGYIKAVT